MINVLYLYRSISFGLVKDSIFIDVTNIEYFIIYSFMKPEP